jgi:hypothetical protein
MSDKQGENFVKLGIGHKSVVKPELELEEMTVTVGEPEMDITHNRRHGLPDWK